VRNEDKPRISKRDLTAGLLSPFTRALITCSDRGEKKKTRLDKTMITMDFETQFVFFFFFFSKRLYHLVETISEVAYGEPE
jgi:hypothetical protein